MRATAYARREKAITAADAGGIRERWEYGRLLLVDDTATTPSGNLRHGVLARLVQATRRAGYTPRNRNPGFRFAGLEREIRYRLQCGRAYPTRSQIGRASADFATWHDLRAAGFPPYPAAESERPYDPRTTRELVKAHSRAGAGILPEPWEQAALFERFADDATLAAMQRYADEQTELTSRFARRCDERQAYLAALIKAVNGDLTATYGQARAALEAR